MTVCSRCGELAMNTITICQDCKDQDEEFELDESWEEHSKGLCDLGKCRFCERENDDN